MTKQLPTAEPEAPIGDQTPSFGVELIDVLIRGLAKAKSRMESDDPEVPRGKLCVGWYVDRDQMCMAWYSDPQPQ